MASMNIKSKPKNVNFEETTFTVVDGDSDSTMNLKELITNRPAIFNFIIGTWCPKCSKYLQGLIAASETLSTGKGPEVFIVSTEANKKLRNYFDKHGTLSELPFRIISDKSKTLINSFGLKVPIFGFARPASVLIQSDESFKIISHGLPSEEQLLEYDCDFLEPSK